MESARKGGVGFKKEGNNFARPKSTVTMRTERFRSRRGRQWRRRDSMTQEEEELKERKEGN